MSRQAPSAGRIFTLVAFAGSCVGLLLFLWISFGGSTPFAAQGYRISAEFPQAVQLGTQADVRIAGVNVGKVVSIELDHHTGLTRAVMEIDKQYAPRPSDTRAILRAKSLLGETYIQLSAGSQTAPKLPDGAMLPEAQVAPTVELDQILSTFDPATRAAFQTWMQQQAIALTGRGEDLNIAIGELYPFATNVDAVLSVLNHDSAATTTLLHDGGQVFSAIAASPAQLQGFTRNANTTFAATAAQDVALANTVRAFPPFLVATRSAINRVATFSETTKPLIDQLRPAAVQLSPALEQINVVAPELRDLLVNIGPLTQASKAGFPAFAKFLDESVPLLVRIKPYLGGVVPVVDYINDYRREVAAFFANSTASTQNTQTSSLGPASQPTLLHVARISNPINPELLAPQQTRLESNRGNPYLEPGGYNQLLEGLPVFGGYLCTSNRQPTVPSTLGGTAVLGSATVTLPELLNDFYYTTSSEGPPCRAQPPLGSSTTGQLQSFPHLIPLP